MAWQIAGTYFETCSCDVVCPCAGDSVDFEIEDVVPFGVESGEPPRMTGIFHPADSELTISRATRSSISAFGIEFEGKSGFSRANFAWAA